MGKSFHINNNKTHVFRVTVDNRCRTNIRQRTINLWPIISEKAAGPVIGMMPFSKIFQVLQMLLNVKALSQRRLLKEKELNASSILVKCQIHT